MSLTTLTFSAFYHVRTSSQLYSDETDIPFESCVNVVDPSRVWSRAYTDEDCRRCTIWDLHLLPRWTHEQSALLHTDLVLAKCCSPSGTSCVVTESTFTEFSVLKSTGGEVVDSKYITNTTDSQTLCSETFFLTQNELYIITEMNTVWRGIYLDDESWRKLIYFTAI